MKYKIGDKVKIKTWKEIEEEYGCENRDSENIYCKCACVFLKKMETNIEELNCNRILTIKNNCGNFYEMREINWAWSDDMIKCLVKDKSDPVLTRFDILDIR